MIDGQERTKDCGGFFYMNKDLTVGLSLIHI